MTNLNTIKLNWIHSLRWMAGAFQFILIYPALKFGYLNAGQLPFYLIVVAILLIFNLKILWEKLIPSYYQKVSTQVIFDLCIFTILILLTGKMENPFWPLIYFHAALAAVLLPPKADIIFLPFLFGSMLLVHLLSISYYSSVIFILIPQWIVLIAIWFLSRQLSLHLSKQRKEIHTLQARELKHQKLKSLASLSSGILHEIGTPLNTIRLKTDRLIHKGANAISEQDIEVMDLSLKSIEDVVNHLNQAQYETAKDLIQKVNITDYLKELILIWHKEFSGLEIELNITQNWKVYLGKANFNLVMKVILDNAKEAQATKIIINANEESSSVILNFNDNGPGFDPFILENFGAPYTSTKGKGHGIGLYSAALGLESMGGAMKINNQETGGALIKIILEKVDEN